MHRFQEIEKLKAFLRLHEYKSKWFYNTHEIFVQEGNNSKITKIKFENFKEIPSLVLEFPPFSSVRYIDFSPSYLSTLPASITTLKLLNRINMRRNNIKSIPKNLLKIENLEYLDLSQNKLKEIPDAIWRLKNLQYLDLSKNKIQSLPNTLVYLNNLRYLYLQDNQLTKIPKQILRLNQLKKLNIKDNKLDFGSILGMSDLEQCQIWT